ncbi:MAG: endolytic transglycosylase MltG [Geobacter sp.]|nr:endolytic transglycosylase MltG [Geobacter sp.]
MRFKSLFRHIPLPQKKKTWLIVGVVAISLLLPTSFAIFLATAPGIGKVQKLVDFPEGTTLKKVAAGLKQDSLVTSSALFSIYGRVKGAGSHLKAGTYQLDDGMTPPEILRKLVAGDVYVHRFTVPEGYSIYQVAELLEQQGFFKKDAFLRQCFNRELLQELKIDGRSVEGYLFPSTYDVSPKMDEAGLIREMVGQFGKFYDERFASRVRAIGKTRRQVLTMASIIEKEAMVASERPVISSVFHNRLVKRMPLQSDPTAIYSVRAFGGKVTKQDLENDSPYNTYHVNGLPPGPIGNPSPSAIEAALNPARTAYLYFVARKDGTHYFTTNLDDHNRGVRKYLKQGVAENDSTGRMLVYRNDRPNPAGRR